MSEMNTETVIVLRSVTHSMKAKKLLSINGVRSRTVKPPTDKEKGCAYGIAVAATQADFALGILYDKKIPVQRIVKMS